MSEVDILSIILIAFGLSADCFAVALSGSIAMKSFRPVQLLHASAAFGVFQTGMTFLGWLAGKTFVSLIAGFDHWIAFGLLAFIGGKMIWESFHEKEEEQERDFTRGWILIVLAVSTSLDALAVGLSFAMLMVNIWLAIAVIGAIAFLVTASGFLIGSRLGRFAGKRAETIGGLILIGIGLRILISHLLEG